MKTLVVTVPGMGKTTYVKNKNQGIPVEQRKVVDFDYKCPFKSMTKELKYENTKVMSEWLESGVADVVLANVDWVSFGALNNTAFQVLFVYPSDVKVVESRILERDKLDPVNLDLQQYVDELKQAEQEFSHRFNSKSVTMETLENLDEIIQSNETSESPDNGGEAEAEEEPSPTPPEGETDNPKSEDDEADDQQISIEEIGELEPTGDADPAATEDEALKSDGDGTHQPEGEGDEEESKDNKKKEDETDELT